MVKKKLDRFFKNVIKGKKRGFISSLIKMILLPFSWGYHFGVKCRNALYDWGLMRRYVPPIPLVISIGNIVAGGTGKTPLTLKIAEAFYNRYLIAILSRGYRSKAEKLETPIVLCQGAGPLYPAAYCGDEPFLFAQRLPKALVIVNADRKKSSLIAAKAGVQVVLLDDALQHRSFARDFEVIVVDVGDPFGQGYFLPRGFLRDELKALSRADLIVLSHAENVEQRELVKDQIKVYSNTPIVSMQEKVTAVRDFSGSDVEVPQNTPVGMFCGIANPDYFRKTLETMGLRVVCENILQDHQPISEKELEKFAQVGIKKGAQWIVCTEKDRVKLPDYLFTSLPIVWVQIDLEIIDGMEEWSKFIKNAELKI
ncbi:MAG: tetraacyldisaccharide 4'-kinase [Parachlamydiaceae bacterium]|nr:tetraacyldisaccharide 4'-kinase [Parachlamydiaceae bacterium]